MFARRSKGVALAGSATCQSVSKVVPSLTKIADPASATPFDRRANIGLHHLALRVADIDTLRTVFARVQNHPGTVIEFDPEPIREGATTHHFICAMPGGIRIEFATSFA